MNTFWEWAGWGHDKLGDGIVATLDEFRFWTEVVAEFMEWDESSAKRIAADYKDEIREQLKTCEDVHQAVKAQMEMENEIER